MHFEQFLALYFVFGIKNVSKMLSMRFINISFTDPEFFKYLTKDLQFSTDANKSSVNPYIRR